MTDNVTARTPVLAALRRADAVIGIGDTYGWPRPQAYTDALAMLNAAREAEAATPSMPAAPSKPKDVAKWVDTVTDIRQRETIRRDVVDDLVLMWERNTAQAGLAATVDYTDRLATLFDERVEGFDAHADAPRALTGHETPDEVQAHTAALRIAGQLTTALMQRAVIADAAQEAEHIGADIIWLILDPLPTTTRDQIEDALKTFKGRFPQTLTEWDELRPLGLQLARIGQIAARRDRHAAVLHAIGTQTPEMGMRDYSYGQVENGELLTSHNSRVIQADSDRLFDQAQPVTL